MEEQKKDTKKKTSIVTWLVLVVFVIIIAVVIDTASNTEPKATSNTEHEPIDISVTSQNIKEVDGKYRYFFNIKNNDEESFTGDINIDLISAEGKSIYDKNFKEVSIGADIGKSIYIDISTGPVQVHGANGISNFEFTASKSGQVIKSGSGSIITQ